MSLRSSLLLAGVLVMLLSGCAWQGSDYQGSSQGGACEATYQCQSSLLCARDGTCQNAGYQGTKNLDESCATSADCRIDLVCGSAGLCATAGYANHGDGCTGTEMCARGLICSGGGACKNPGESGTKGTGTACAQASECELGLLCTGNVCTRPGREGDPCTTHEQCIPTMYFCGTDNKCTKRKASGENCGSIYECEIGLICNFAGQCGQIPIYNGVNCSEPTDDTGAFRAYFEVPRGTITNTIEFYRLPFPNNIRLKNGKVDLSGHANPGTVIPGDVVGKYIRAIESEMDGFGVNTATYVRFSKDVDWNTTTFTGGNPTVRIVNIDSNHTKYGYGHNGIAWSMGNSKGKYICHNWLAFHPWSGYPLAHNTTYAVIVLRGVKSKNGDNLNRDADFEAMLADSRPASDADLGTAWDKYKIFRDFLDDGTLPADRKINKADVMVAAVFTTMDPDKHIPAFREVIHNNGNVPAPAPKDVTLCKAAVTSPCDDGLSGSKHERGCFGESSEFHEIHGRIATPIFQQGTPPYETSGGEITYDVNGKPTLQGQQDVCFGLTVPKGASMPANGWPLVIYLHGTGASFRSHIANGVAGNLAAIDLGGAVTANVAVLGIDQVVHGARRGASTTSPENLFFNFLNPPAAKNNTLQGAADLFQMVRAAKSFDEQVTGVGRVKFDPKKIYFFGHSQGSITGPPAVVFEPDIAGVVYSGAGGVLIESLLNKTKPVDIASALKYVLGEISVGYSHPVLNLLQLYFEPSDTINYGEQLFRAPVSGMPRRHVLMSYGLNDSYTPNVTGEAFMRALGVPIVKPVLDPPNSGIQTIDAPVNRNWASEVTVGAVQLATDGSYDGHFVIFDNPYGKKIYKTFLGTMATDASGVPTIPAQ